MKKSSVAVAAAVAVIGPGSCDAATAEAARLVGRALAENGITLFCGGLGGAMEAACRGAREAGGTTVGILPGTCAGDANAFVDIPVVTGMGEARNVILVRSVGAVIAVGGEYGTLSEIAFALKLGIPVIGLRTWKLLRGETLDRGIREADTPQAAVRLALET